MSFQEFATRLDRIAAVKKFIKTIKATSDVREEAAEYQFDEKEAGESIVEDLIERAGSSQDIVCFLREHETSIAKAAADAMQGLLNDFANYLDPLREGMDVDLEVDEGDVAALVDELFPGEAP